MTKSTIISVIIFMSMLCSVFTSFAIDIQSINIQSNKVANIYINLLNISSYYQNGAIDPTVLSEVMTLHPQYIFIVNHNNSKEDLFDYAYVSMNNRKLAITLFTTVDAVLIERALSKLDKHSDYYNDSGKAILNSICIYLVYPQNIVLAFIDTRVNKVTLLSDITDFVYSVKTGGL